LMPDAVEMEELLALAASGDRASARAFFEKFLTFEFYVPCRFQQAALTDSPQYPNDFFNMLGIKRSDAVIIPIFTQADHILNWSGQSFSFKTYSGRKITELIPEGWYVWVNAGQEVEKELTAWEIEQLKIEAYEDLVEENFANLEELSPIQISKLGQNDYAELLLLLKKEAGLDKSIKALYLLKEESLDSEGEKVERLLFGIESKHSSYNQALREKYANIARKNLIGDILVKVLVSSADDSSANNELFYGLFKHYQAFYKK